MQNTHGKRLGHNFCFYRHSALVNWTTPIWTSSQKHLRSKVWRES